MLVSRSISWSLLDAPEERARAQATEQPLAEQYNPASTSSNALLGDLLAPTLLHKERSCQVPVREWREVSIYGV